MRRVVLIGLVYLAISLASIALDRAATTPQGHFAWRLSAWVASAIVFAAHIAYEHFSLHHAARVLARTVGIAVAVGGFLLAVSAMINALRTPSHPPLFLYLIALVTWPVLTGVPAFAVAFVVGKVLDRSSRR